MILRSYKSGFQRLKKYELVIRNFSFISLLLFSLNFKLRILK